jgi:hypothetical protein
MVAALRMAVTERNAAARRAVNEHSAAGLAAVEMAGAGIAAAPAGVPETAGVADKLEFVAADLESMSLREEVCVAGRPLPPELHPHAPDQLRPNSCFSPFTPPNPPHLSFVIQPHMRAGVLIWLFVTQLRIASTLIRSYQLRF